MDGVVVVGGGIGGVGGVGSVGGVGGVCRVGAVGGGSGKHSPRSPSSSSDRRAKRQSNWSSHDSGGVGRISGVGGGVGGAAAAAAVRCSISRRRFSRYFDLRCRSAMPTVPPCSCDARCSSASPHRRCARSIADASVRSSTNASVDASHLMVDTILMIDPIYAAALQPRACVTELAPSALLRHLLSRNSAHLSRISAYLL